MRISISVVASDIALTNDFVTLDVAPDMTLADIKALVEDDLNVQPMAQNYLINGQVATQISQTLQDLGIQDGDVLSLAVQTRQPATQPSRPQNTARRTQGEPSQQRASQRQRPEGAPDPELIRLHLLGNQQQLAELQDRNPALAGAVNDPQRFAQIFEDGLRQIENIQQEKEQMIAQLDADQFNPDAQKKIEEMIRQENVLKNMQKALEEFPESFGVVQMLYIDVLVNNVPVKAFVDCGAQTTIMSPEAAERCGIMRLIDTRHAGIARGVGTAKILGRVHVIDLQIGQYSLASSFTVMEGKDVDLLLGLDTLKRHQMCIDLKSNCLRIGSESVPFLGESEIPKSADPTHENQEENVPGPPGMKFGLETGTVKPATPEPTASGSGSRMEVDPTPPALAQSAPTQQQQASSSAQASSGFPEADIAQVTGSGCTRQEAIEALQKARGNVTQARGAMLIKMIFKK